MLLVGMTDVLCTEVTVTVAGWSVSDGVICTTRLLAVLTNVSNRYSQNREVVAQNHLPGGVSTVSTGVVIYSETTDWRVLQPNALLGDVSSVSV